MTVMIILTRCHRLRQLSKEKAFMISQSLCAENLDSDSCTSSAAGPIRQHGSPAALQKSPSLTCTVYGPDASPNGFVALAAEWNQLVKRTRANNFFSTCEWQTTWWQYLGEGELWVLAFRRADNQALVGIVPLYLVTRHEGKRMGKKQFNLVGCIEVSDYLDIIAAKGWEQFVYVELLTWLQSPQAPHWDIL